MKKTTPIILVLSLCSVPLFSQVFSADSAFQTVRTLSETIGPRPVGSAAERRALDWVASAFRRHGADTAFVQPFTRPDGARGYNTTSGSAIGIFRGATDTAIVIGSHIDSTPRTNPGALDNASGTATMLDTRMRSWMGRRVNE